MLGYDQWMVGDTVDQRDLISKMKSLMNRSRFTVLWKSVPKFEDGEFVGLYRIKADGFEVEKKKISWNFLAA